MTFEEIGSALTTEGYTRSHNGLDDLLLRELPHDYYCFWRFLWRKLFGWQETEGDVSLRTIAKGANLSLNAVSRIAWFFHCAQVISYKPGIKQEQTISHFVLLPVGMPDLEELHKIIQTLDAVLEKEKVTARARNDRHFQFKVQQFVSELGKEWQARGGQVSQPIVAEKKSPSDAFYSKVDAMLDAAEERAQQRLQVVQ